MKSKLRAFWAGIVFVIEVSTSLAPALTVVSASSASAQVVHPGPRLGCPLCALTLELEQVKRPTVVYSAVRDTENGEVRMIRMSALPNLTPTSTYVDTKPLSYSDWKRYTDIAADPSAERYRRELKEKMLGGRGDDGDALVFFEDRTGANVNPSVIGLDGAAKKSGTLSAATSQRLALAAKSESVPTFDAYLGFPLTEADSRAIFGDQETASIQDWQKEHAAFLGDAGPHNLDVVDVAAIRKLGTKEAFLAKLAHSDNIIFIVVHGDKAQIRLPGREPFTVTPEDIAALRLEKGPFVFLRVCESSAGDNAGFARAFIGAGARGVSFNTGKIAAAEARAETFKFLKALKETRSILDALNRLSREEKIRVRTQLMTLIKRIIGQKAG